MPPSIFPAEQERAEAIADQLLAAGPTERLMHLTFPKIIATALAEQREQYERFMAAAEKLAATAEKIDTADPGIQDTLHEVGCAYDEGRGDAEDCECPNATLLGNLWSQRHEVQSAAAAIRRGDA